MQIRCTFINDVKITMQSINITIQQDNSGEKIEGENVMINVWKQNITSQHSKEIIWHASVAVALILK